MMQDLSHEQKEQELVLRSQHSRAMPEQTAAQKAARPLKLKGNAPPSSSGWAPQVQPSCEPLFLQNLEALCQAEMTTQHTSADSPVNNVFYQLAVQQTPRANPQALHAVGIVSKLRSLLLTS